MRRAGLAAAEAATAVLGAGGGALPLGDLPLSVRIASLTAGGDSRFGVALDIPVGKQFVLFDGSDVRLSLEVVDEWLADPGIAPPTVGGRGLELYVLRIPAAGDPSLAPRVVVRGLGLRIDRPDGEKLLDLGVTLRSVGVHGYLDKDITTPDVRVGGHLELDQFGLPLGGAGGNPVAANFMAPTSDAGDAEQLARRSARAWRSSPSRTSPTSTSSSAPDRATDRGGCRSSGRSGPSTSSRSGSASSGRRAATRNRCRSSSTAVPRWQG